MVPQRFGQAGIGGVKALDTLSEKVFLVAETPYAPSRDFT
jgi:hypothetical protein